MIPPYSSPGSTPARGDAARPAFLRQMALVIADDHDRVTVF
jgi:hypothetical protein